VPSEVVLSKNSTVPVAMLGVTVAVKVTDPPNVDGLLFELRPVLEGALFTVCVNIGEVLLTELVSPLYVAVMEWLPTDNVDVVRDAESPTSVAVPNEVMPSKNSTVPVGNVPAPTLGVTFAVNLTV